MLKTLRLLPAILLTAIVHVPNIQAQPDLSGVWVLLQHDRPGGLFGAPADPVLSARGQEIVDDFRDGLAPDAPERGAFCVNSGMPESMFGIAGYPLDIIQREKRITFISEFQSEVRRVYLDGRAMPEDYPVTRNGYSVGRWIREDGGDVLEIDTALIKAWEVDKWVHSEAAAVKERISLVNASKLTLGERQAREVEADELVMQNIITVTDPVMYERPQTVTVWMKKVPDSTLLEYNCNEYNWRNALKN